MTKPVSKSYSMMGKIQLDGYVNCWVDTKTMMFFEQYRGKGNLVRIVPIHNPVFGKLIMVKKVGGRHKTPIVLGYLISVAQWTKDMLKESQLPDDPIKPVKVVQRLSKNEYGLCGCPDCGFMQPNENISCVKCDQSLY